MKLAAGLLIAMTAAGAASSLQSCPATPQAGEPLRGLNEAELARFAAGRALFESAFTPETGLGPLFNAEACGECHEEPALGGNGDERETHATVANADGTCDLLAAHGGPVFQSHVTPALKAALGIEAEPIPAAATTRAVRTSPDLFGFGLLEAIPDAAILAKADSADRDHDGISGRVNRFLDGRIGRFGRKAFIASLDEFNAGAFVIEMGITSPGAPEEESIGGKSVPAGVDPTPEPEISGDAVSLVSDFIRFLAPPPALPLTSEGERGRLAFGTIGCASCHTPTMVTGAHTVHALDRRQVHAYTDLLLHDMGEERADICLGYATPSEFRTEPLMGLRLATQYLHDGAATSIEQAIDLHSGEAKASRERFRRLKPRDRAALLEFLRSL